MKHFEAIILAGGLGTRIKGTLGNIPKAMAPIMGTPFLAYQFDFLIDKGVKHLILSIHHLGTAIEEYFGNAYRGCSISYAKEPELLGTGGAIAYALQYTQNKHIFVLNGDSIFDCSLQGLYDFHLDKKAHFSMALRPSSNVQRYGTVLLDRQEKVTGFQEKKNIEEGLINTGIYLIDQQTFTSQVSTSKFSLEKELLPQLVSTSKVFGQASKGYFVDIGIPRDFEKAQMELGVFAKINHHWTLFLDRDGVINQQIIGDYVRDINQFELLPRVKEALQSLKNHFQQIIVVTNQQGVGKGLMPVSALEEIHGYMLKQLPEINAVYYASEPSTEHSINRKPHIGMALKAQKDFPNIDFKKSVMVGDSISDMDFAKNMGAQGVMIGNNIQEPYYHLGDLFELATQLEACAKIGIGY